MPITLKQGIMAYRDNEGEYHDINVVAEATTANQIAAIQSAGTSAIASVQAAGQATIASIPNEYTELSDSVDDLKSAIDKFTVPSKNILPISGKNSTVNGVNVTYADGQLTFSGTANANGGRTNKLCDVFTLQAGTYTFWSEPNTGFGSLYIQTESGNTTISACNNNTTGTFTLNEATSVYFGYNFTNGTAYDKTWKIQLEKSAEKTTFEKPSAVKAVDSEARALIASNTERIEALESVMPYASKKLTFVLNDNEFSIVTDFNNSELTLTGFVTQSDKDNPAFDFNAYSGAFVKTAQDDICPVYYNGSYRCGGHGNNVVMNLTCASHGLTESDIGKSFTLDGVAWILLKIIDTSHVWVISDITNVPTRPFVTTIADSGTLVGTNKNIVYTAKSVVQLLPNNITRQYAIYGDGKPITENGTYELEELKLVESYQSLDCIAMVEYLKTHIGSNTNSTYCSNDRAGELIYDCTYTFHGESDCVVSQTLTALRDNIDMSTAGITQVQPYSSTAYVPFTSYATPTAISSTTLTLSTDTWDDADFPPYKYYELDSTTHLAFACGYDISFGMGVPAKRKTNVGTNAGNYNGTSKKIYPKFFGNGQVMPKGSKISGTAFRMPVVYNNNLIAYQWKNGNDTFFEIEIFASGTYTFDVGINNVGKKVEIVKASDALHLDDIVAAYSNMVVVASGAGSATLKIHD